MDLYTINKIKNNPYIYKFLREEPKYYKNLNRNKNSLKEIENIVKEKYKIRPIDKINNIKDKINIINNIIDVLK